MEITRDFVEMEIAKPFDWSIYANSSEYDTSQIESEIEAEWREPCLGSDEGPDVEYEALVAFEVFLVFPKSSKINRN